MTAGDRTADYDFELPPDRIAQTPLDRRDESRLMVVDRASATIAHHTFADLPAFVPAGDVLVRNTTRVMRARLLGTRDSGAPAEILLLKPLGDARFEAMVRPDAVPRNGARGLRPRRAAVFQGMGGHADKVGADAECGSLAGVALVGDTRPAGSHPAAVARCMRLTPRVWAGGRHGR